MMYEMKQQGRKWRRVLIVLNKQIIGTWMDEFARWVPQRPYPLRFITAGSQLSPPHKSCDWSAAPHFHHHARESCAPTANSDQRSRAQEIRKWHRREGGVLLITGHLLQRLTEAGAGTA
jgi:SNF2 family DNA or RNA helicase